MMVESTICSDFSATYNIAAYTTNAFAIIFTLAIFTISTKQFQEKADMNVCLKWIFHIAFLSAVTILLSLVLWVRFCALEIYAAANVSVICYCAGYAGLFKCTLATLLVRLVSTFRDSMFCIPQSIENAAKLTILFILTLSLISIAMLSLILLTHQSQHIEYVGCIECGLSISVFRVQCRSCLFIFE